MKFLCDNCKAKYQIADEKVAGKTVRMKCRKCGHQIEVRAAVTETSVANAPPREQGATNAPPRPPQKSGGLATSLSATKPRAPSPSVSVVPGSALAGAFQRNLHEAPASVPPGAQGSTIELSVTDEWYVSINGVPVGPVRISELRRKAASGVVTEESLCWQEGLEEWRPIRSIPDLAALVREAAAGNRPSLIATPEPTRASRDSSAPRPTATAPLARPMISSPSAHPRSAESRSNVVPLRPAASLSSDVGPIGGAGSATALSPAIQPTPHAPMFQTPAPLIAPVALDPFSIPPAPAPAYRDATPSLVYQQPRRAVPLWFWPILLLALGFGGGVAFLVFRPQPIAPPVVIQMPPAATLPAPPTTGATTDIAPPTTEPTSVGSETKPSGKGAVVASKVTPPKTGPEEKKGLDLGNLVPGAGGPNVNPNTTGGSAGGGLDQAGVERVVAQHRNGVKRTCWERGGADQKSSVNVTVSANVAPNGSVASTSSSGDDPVVAKCIESQVKNWQFPAPGASMTINIPFKFVRQ